MPYLLEKLSILSSVFPSSVLRLFSGFFCSVRAAWVGCGLGGLRPPPPHRPTKSASLLSWRNSSHSGPCGAAEGSEFSSPLGSCSLSQLSLRGTRWVEASVESLRATSSYLELPDQPEGVTTKREEWIFKDPQMGSTMNIFQVI